MLRSILAVLGGWALVGVLVVSTDGVLAKLYPNEYVHGKIPPDWLSAVSLCTSILWSVAGAWVTAAIAKVQVWKHMVYLIVWGEIMGIASAVASWGQIQPWYQIGLLVAWPIAVLAGGWIRSRQAATTAPAGAY